MTRTIFAAAMLAAALAPAAHAQLQLVWSDEFDGSSLDPSKWEPLIGDGCAFGICGWGNNEWQYYTDRPENITVANGELTITARREDFGGKSYTSARLRTQGKADFLYGRIEARMKLPSATGVWPAFWMLPTGSPYGGWPASGEIDIMESVNQADRIYGTIHYGNPGSGSTSTGGSTTFGGIDFSADFHTFAVEWEPDQIRWYIDGAEWGFVNSSQWFSGSPEAAGNPLAPFDSPFHILLNVAVGGNFPGDPNASEYPQQMVVDWVRVYEFPQQPFTLDDQPHPIPGRIEAEDFDEGFADQAYFDADTSNNGGQYRSTGVDIEASTEGGFNVGWIETGEWLEYTVEVAESGTYRIDTRVASQITGGTFGFRLDGQPVSADVVGVPTGGWQNWTTASTEVELDAGTHVLRWENRSSPGASYNLNWFEFVLLAAPCPADIDGNGTLNVDDIDAFVALFLAGDPAVDFDSSGSLNVDDIDGFVAAFLAGCP